MERAAGELRVCECLQIFHKTIEYISYDMLKHEVRKLQCLWHTPSSISYHPCSCMHLCRDSDTQHLGAKFGSSNVRHLEHLLNDRSARRSALRTCRRQISDVLVTQTEIYLLKYEK